MKKLTECSFILQSVPCSSSPSHLSSSMMAFCHFGGGTHRVLIFTVAVVAQFLYMQSIVNNNWQSKEKDIKKDISTITRSLRHKSISSLICTPSIQPTHLAYPLAPQVIVECMVSDVAAVVELGLRAETRRVVAQHQFFHFDGRWSVKECLVSCWHWTYMCTIY